jgi:hypothetical protein
MAVDLHHDLRHQVLGLVRVGHPAPHEGPQTGTELDPHVLHRHTRHHLHAVDSLPPSPTGPDPAGSLAHRRRRYSPRNSHLPGRHIVANGKPADRSAAGQRGGSC